MTWCKYAQALHAEGKCPANVTRFQAVVHGFCLEDVVAHHSVMTIGNFGKKGLSDCCAKEDSISQTLIQGYQGKCSWHGED